MALIDEAYQLLKYRAAKSGFNGNISPNDFNLIWKRAEIRFFNGKYKTFQINQDNTDSILAFKTDPLPITVDGAGKYIKPADVLHIDALTHNYNSTQVEIKRVENDRLGNKLSSTYDAPNAEFPIYVEYKTYLQFYPTNLANANFVYLKRITPAFWGYDLVGGVPVYNESKSTQPAYDETELDDVLNLALLDGAINMKDSQLESTAERQIQKDQ